MPYFSYNSSFSCNVEFRNINNKFQEKLKNDIKELRKSDKVFVSADKSLNIYKMEKDEYKKLLFENVTKTYKKVLQPPIKTYGCNCRNKESCPLDNKCKTPKIIYRTDVSNNVDNETKFFMDLLKLHSKKDMVTIKSHLNMKNISMKQNCQNIFGIYMSKINHFPLCEALQN